MPGNLKDKLFSQREQILRNIKKAKDPLNEIRKFLEIEQQIFFINNSPRSKDRLLDAVNIRSNEGTLAAFEYVKNSLWAHQVALENMEKVKSIKKSSIDKDLINRYRINIENYEYILDVLLKKITRQGK